MKKLLAIILAIVCIIPTMAVSFSVSAKSVGTTNVSVTRYTEKCYVVKKTKAQQKYKFNYSISNNKKNYVVAKKENTKKEMKLYIGGSKVTNAKKPVVSVFYKKGKSKVVVKKYSVKVTEYKLSNQTVQQTKNVTVKFPAKAKDLDFKILTTYGEKKKATVDVKKSQKGNNIYTITGNVKGKTKGALYVNSSYFDKTKTFKNTGKRLICVFDINVASVQPVLKTSNLSLYKYVEKYVREDVPKDNQKYKYGYYVSDNEDNNIKVKSSFFSNSAWEIVIGANTATTDKKPVVTIYYERDKKKIPVRKFVVTVKEYQIQDINICAGKEDDLALNEADEIYKNSMMNSSYLNCVVDDENIAVIDSVEQSDGSYAKHIIGKSVGSTKVSVYIDKGFFDNSLFFKPEERLLCTFTVNVGEYKPQIVNSAKNLKLEYSDYLNSSSRDEWVDFFFKLYKDIPSMLYNEESDAQYRIETSDKNVIAINGNSIVTTAVGNATYTLYSISGDKETKIGDFKVQVSKIKMSDLADCNAEIYDDGIFYNDQISVNLKKEKTFNALSEIKDKVLSSSHTDIKFASADYKLTYKVKDTNIATVDSKGVITAKKKGQTVFEYTITFNDGSTYKDSNIELTVN